MIISRKSPQLFHYLELNSRQRQLNHLTVVYNSALDSTKASVARRGRDLEKIFTVKLLNRKGDRIAAATGLGESFIGALLLAATTSLPEAVAGLAAIRLNALDLAISNVFGSNIFNLAILGIYDIVYVHGNLWTNISRVHIFTAVVTMIITSVAIVMLIYRAARPTRLYLTWDGLALIALYMGGMYVIYCG